MATNPYWTRNDALGATLLHTLRALEPNANRVRGYSDPAVDRFKRQVDRDVDARDRERDEEAVSIDPRSAEEFFYDEQCPSDATFR